MQYNKTLDYTVLALDAMRQSKPVLAARLLAKAGEQKDLSAAIQILEHSNKTAHAAEVRAKLVASKRLRANEQEAPEFEDDEEEGAPVEGEFEGDPLDEVEGEEPEATPAVAMASVLKSLVRR